MKTQKHTNQTLPSPVKFSLYIIAVAAVCFLNWSALNAADYSKSEVKTLEARLEAALVPVVEEEIQLENWMLNISDEVAVETEIVLEDWMLTFNDNLIASSEESEITLEDWMLTFNDNLIASSEEPKIGLEEWMLEVPDPAPAIEDWMVNTETWAKVEFLATK